MKTLLLLASLALAVLPGRAADSTPVPASPAAFAAASGLPIAALVGTTPKAADGSTIAVPDDVQAWIKASLDAGTVQDFSAVLAARVPHWPNAAFLRRFTPAERQAFYAAAAQSPALEDLKTLLLATPEVVSTDADLVAGMSALVAAGIITADRRAQILSSGSSP